MRWFNVYWSSGIMLVLVLVMAYVTKQPPKTAGALSLILLPLAMIGLVHMLIGNVIEGVYILRSMREDKKPFSQWESNNLPELISEAIEIARIDSGAVDHVIAAMETNAATLQTNLNWMKGCVLGGAAGIAALVYQGSAMRTQLERWVSPAVSLSTQVVLLLGFCMMFVMYVALWRRIVHCENRARFLKHIRERRSFLLSLESKANS
jgi:hypothetical protein